MLLHHIEGIGHGAKPGRPAAEATATVLAFLARHTGLIPAAAESAGAPIQVP